MILKNGQRSPGYPHAPSLAGLGAPADDPTTSVLSTGEGTPHEQGRLGGREIHVFPRASPSARPRRSTSTPAPHRPTGQLSTPTVMARRATRALTYSLALLDRPPRPAPPLRPPRLIHGAL